MKRLLCILPLLVLLLAATPAKATASTPSVQLDGQPLVFTDAVPQVVDQRVFLPYRALFEAMGATVSYDTATGAVAAVRGDVSVTMTIGSTTAQVTRRGVTSALEMDVAPYVDSATWRTYVPVRFAADAFGCNVGWDQEALTAVIVDVDRLVDDAFSGDGFTTLAAMTAFNDQFETGSWAISGDMSMSLALEELTLLRTLGSYQGITAGENTAQVTMETTTDLTGLVALLSLLGEDSEVPTSLTSAAELRSDAATGLLYVHPGELFNQILGSEENTWYAMELADHHLGGLAGMTDHPVTDTVKALLSAVDLDGKAQNGYGELKAALDALATGLADESFTAADGIHTATTTFTVEPSTVAFTIQVLTDEAGAVTETAATMTAQLDLSGREKDPEAVFSADYAEVMFYLDQDSSGSYGTLELQMDALNLVLSAYGLQSPTDQTPETAPPDGAVVVNYDE